MTTHYWTGEMADERGDERDFRSDAPRYRDLCGVDNSLVNGEPYTAVEKDVTCKRCLAALRSRSGAAGAGPEASAPSAPHSTPQGTHAPSAPVPADDALAVLKNYSRAAVLAERERCVRVMVEFFGGGEQAYPLVEALARAIREEK